MFKKRAGSVGNTPEELREGERLRLRLSAFGEGAAENPVKAEIAALRELRNAGLVNPNEYAERVAVLLGFSEGESTSGDAADTQVTDVDEAEALYR